MGSGEDGALLQISIAHVEKNMLVGIQQSRKKETRKGISRITKSKISECSGENNVFSG